MSRIVKACLLVVAGMVIGYSQETRGSIFGRTTDPQGSAVPDVTVTVTNAGTNTSVVLKTNNTGYYEAGLLVAGTYTVSFHTPAGYAHTLANQACNVGGQPADATDSDCDCAAGGSCGR